MKTAVIGAGAMGSLIGAHLADGGNEVTLVDVWKEHVDEINEKGLRIEKGSEEKTVCLKAVNDSSVLGPQDLVIIFVKSYHTENAVKSAANLFTEDTVVLTLQNGLGNAEMISRAAGNVEIVAGTTSHGATVLGPGFIRHAGAGETIIGKFDGENTPRVEEVSSEFNRCGLETKISDNIAGLVWGKLLVNVGINPLTAICGVYNGELNEFESTQKLMEMAVGEAEKVAAAKGIELPYTDALEKVKGVARATGPNRSSMLQDVERGRRTEIDYINGAIAAEGNKLGVDTPANQVITLLIKALEEKKEKEKNVKSSS
ncbi:MAG: 2-dehydropantoate 2-reductase [Clostridiales bacterium]|nr:2-dehydropantoate 2-reductase [Clostridiales bacterium]MCF8022230.1 2-dehydropantoate 2-reductase [Clostridiales bacterium]